MKILYVSQYFPPEVCAPAARVSELTRHWANSGHDVTVLTGFPNHPTGVVPQDYRKKFWCLIYRELVGGTRVVRTWLIPLPNRKSYERILNYASFCLSSCLTGMFLSSPDYIIATSPQLLVGLTGWWLSLVKRVPFILEIRDLWPESLTAVGMGNEASMVHRSLHKLAGFLYRACDHIVVVTPAFKEELVTKWNVNPEKISVVQNGVETDIFTPDGTSDEVSDALNLNGKFIVSYIGTIGIAHGLGAALDAAAKIRKTLPDILFLFVGEGADKERLISMARERGLDNVCFLPQQSRGKIPAIIRASSLCLVLLRKADVFKTVIPTKMLEFMACGRPVILGVDGQARQILDEAQAGIFVEPDNSDDLAQAITQLHQNVELCETLGQNGRRYIVERLSREHTASVYANVLEKVIKRKPQISLQGDIRRT